MYTHTISNLALNGSRRTEEAMYDTFLTDAILSVKNVLCMASSVLHDPFIAKLVYASVSGPNNLPRLLALASDAWCVYRKFMMN